MTIFALTMQQHVFSIAQTCFAAGVEHAIICPGSRSAPLVYAFKRSPINCISVVDERSAGYIALGMAQQTGKPVVLICTSGTAALNFFPAIAEAFYQQIPLIVLTADRPPELLNQQDGQMIMQQNVFGTHVKMSAELPCYTPGTENHKETVAVIIKLLNTSMLRAKGPVHLNIPLAEPLYPDQRVDIPAVPAFYHDNVVPALNVSEITWIENTWRKARKKLVIVGQMPCNAALTGALQELKKDGDTVILCDILSNQYAFNTAPTFDYLFLRADAQTLEQLAPDCIISLGGPVLSKPLKKWLKQQKPETHIRFNEKGWPVDTYQNVTRSFEVDAAPVLFQLGLRATTSEISYFKLFWQQANSVVLAAGNQYLKQADWNELTAVNYLMTRIPDAANVQTANSSVIRYISYLGLVNPSWVMNGNRGTSGIDGSTSTALGAALVNNRPTFLLTGDLAFFYDNNALWNGLPSNLKIIVINNGGGGIFQLIDGPGKHKKELNYFTTPHQQQIGPMCEARGIKHLKVSSMEALAKVSANFFSPDSPAAVLEIVVDRDKNAADFKRYKQFPL
jgi:2-succinyl-5-enolpyruvyl-6-hydroxy-3-cyclohexene-1-carboxylate synthase